MSEPPPSTPGSDSVEVQQAKFRCEACYVSQRSCDRTMPRCSRCGRLGLDCRYPTKSRRTKKKKIKKTTKRPIQGDDIAWLMKAWIVFRDQCRITEDTCLDVYAFKTRQISRRGDLFAPEIDARLPISTTTDKIWTHHPENLVVCSAYLNSWKGMEEALMIPILKRLITADSPNEEFELMQRVEHLFLRRSLLPHKKEDRLLLPVNHRAVQAFQALGDDGFADPEICQQLPEPYRMIGTTEGYRNIERADRDFPRQEVVDSVLKEIEALPGTPLPFINGVPYPYSTLSAPTVWSTAHNLAIASRQKKTMLHLCDRHFRTDLKVDAVFVTQCILWKKPGLNTPFAWLRHCVTPWVRHPLKVSLDHAAHGFAMKLGLPNDFQRLADFNEAECNVNSVPWPWNTMRGFRDDQLDIVIEELRKEVPLDNKPYWSGDLRPIQPVPNSFAPPSKKFRGTKKATEQFNAKKPSSDKTEGVSKSSKRPAKPQGETIKPAKKPSSGKTDGVSKSSQTPAKLKGEIAKPAPHSFSGIVLSEPSSTAPPPYANLRNNANTCYAASVIQCVFHIPSLVSVLDSEFPGLLGRRNATVERPEGFIQTLDAGRRDHQLQVVEQLKVMRDAAVDTTQQQIPTAEFRKLMDRVRRVDAQFVLNEEYDAAVFFDCIRSVLNDAGDVSYRKYELRQKNTEAQPHTYIELEQREMERIMRKVMIGPLRDDRTPYLNSHRSLGNDSMIARVVEFQVAQEFKCSQPSCESPISRSWHQMQEMVLQFPGSDEPGYDPTKEWKIQQLIERWSVVEVGNLEDENSGAECGVDWTHPRKVRGERKITMLSELLVMRIGRLTVRATGCTMKQAERDRQIHTNKVHIDELIDLQPWVGGRTLPSEEMLEPMSTANMRTRYALTGIVQYRHAHYVAYIKVLDPASGNKLRWAFFDDTKDAVRWENPFTTKMPPNAVEFLLIFKQLSPEEAIEMDALKISPTIQPSKEPIEISSGEEDSEEEEPDKESSEGGRAGHEGLGEDAVRNSNYIYDADGLLVDPYNDDDTFDAAGYHTWETNDRPVKKPSVEVQEISDYLETVAIAIEEHQPVDVGELRKAASRVKSLAKKATAPSAAPFDEGTSSKLSEAREELEATQSRLAQMKERVAEVKSQLSNVLDPVEASLYILERMSLLQAFELQKAIAEYVPRLVREEIGAIHASATKDNDQLNQEVVDLRQQLVDSRAETNQLYKQLDRTSTPFRAIAPDAPTRIPVPVRGEGVARGRGRGATHTRQYTHRQDQVPYLRSKPKFTPTKPKVTPAKPIFTPKKTKSQPTTMTSPTKPRWR